MRLLPRSLMGQVMFALTLALFVAQAASFALLVRAGRQERDAVFAAAAATSIADVAERLRLGLAVEREPLPERRIRRHHGHRDDGPDGPLVGRRDAAMRLAGDGVRLHHRRITVGATPDLLPGMVADRRLALRISHLLAEGGTVVTAVRAGQMRLSQPGPDTHDGPRRNLVGVAARLPDGRWITVRARVRDWGFRLFAPLVLQTLVLFVIVLAPMLWLTRRVARPLATLTRNAAVSVPGKESLAVTEEGPEDVRLLTRAFNDLGSRIRAMLADKDRMLGAVGHDLRTPLASLRVRVEQVTDSDLRDAMAATIADMATMLDDIVMLARAGRGGEPAVPTDLAALVADLVDDYRMMQRPVALAGQGDVVTVVVRPAALRRALRNLIDNAVKYGGSAEVGVEDRGAMVAVAVRDRGPGIAADQIAAMMEPFARAEVSRNRDTGGAGLGLALAQAVIEGEGGAISLANAADGGLVATLLLPKA